MRVNAATVGEIVFPPPLPEQRRIVERIDEPFSEIAEGEAALGEARKGLDLFRRALLKAAVIGELTRDWRAVNKPAETDARYCRGIEVEETAIVLGSRVPIFPSCLIRGPGARYLRPGKFNWGGKGRLNIMMAITCDHICGSRTCSKISWTYQT